MMVPLTPTHSVDVNSVSMVALTSDDGELVCRVFWNGGDHWDIRGNYAVVAWVGWMTFWKGRIPMEVKVPCAIIQKLRQNADAHVIGQAQNM